jgi:2-polyprenyl-3-methyl-5-hydroxy-6-metoxy-1,4-benzoquinol methylase
MLVDKYGTKSASYYGNYRQDILQLVPKHVGKVLEIGCGTGNTLAYLKDNGHCDWIGGVELFADAASQAASKLDWISQDNIEEMELQIEASSIDMILCLDVLEHLVNPQKVVAYLHTLLTPGGIIIASIPNVRHYSVVVPLVFGGQWEYKSAGGILDNTHLRFFVKNTAIELMESSGLKLDKVINNYAGKKGNVMNIMTLSLLRHFFSLQYFIRVKNIRSST